MGRSPDAHIRIPDYFQEVSRRHAVIWYEKGDLWICDLDSRGGTSVNGVWLKPRMAFRAAIGDRIVLSDAELRLTASAVSAAISDTVIELALSEGAEQTICHEVKSGDLYRRQLEGITPAELKILLWMRRGYATDQELAYKLHRSANTVRTHVASLFQKLRVNSRSEILALLNRIATGGFAPIESDQLEDPIVPQ
jgi:DNA-binding CsgD family transcriptional regulator